MSPSSNGQLARELFEEVYNTGNLDRLAEFFSPEIKMNAYWYSPTDPPSTDGQPQQDDQPEVSVFEQMKQGITWWKQNYQETRDEIDQIIEADDQVVVLETIKIKYLDGTPADIKSIHIFRFENGKIIEDTWLWDRLGNWQQIGIVPPTSQLDAQLKERLS